MRCSFIKRDGTRCLARAVRADLDGFCVWHSSLNFAAKRKAHEVTTQELVATIGREIRRLRKMKDLDPLQKANEIRNLIVVWKMMKELKVPGTEETLEKRTERWKQRQGLA